MNRQRVDRLIVLCLLLVVVAGCGGEEPTPVVLVVTLAPTQPPAITVIVTPPPPTEQAGGLLPQPTTASPPPTEQAGGLLPQPTTVPPPPTEQAGSLLPQPTTASPLPPAPLAGAITPANARQLAEARWTHVSPNARNLAWSPDGRWLAVADAYNLDLYDAATLDPLPLPHKIEADALAFSPDGALLAVTRYEYESAATKIDLWRVADWTLARTLDSPYNESASPDLAFRPDTPKGTGGNLLAVASGASLRIWNVADGTLVQDLALPDDGGRPAAILSVAWSPDGQQVVAGVYGGSVQGWRVSDGEQSIYFQASAAPQPNEVHFLPDGRLLTLNGPSAQVWQGEGSSVARLESERSLFGGDLSPDGQLLAAAAYSPDGEGVELWDLGSMARVHWLNTGDVNRVAFSPDGRLLATLEGGDDQLRLWGLGVDQGQAPPAATSTTKAKPRPTPTARFPVTGRYAQVWARLGGAEGRLGQPLGPAVEDTFAFQHFEHGLMHWGRWDTEGTPEREVQVIVYGDGGSNRQAGDLWGRFTDYWQEGDETYSCPKAQPPYGPRRGFGLVWCQYVRDSLGAPLEEEYGLPAGYQDFENGTLLWSPTDGGIYVLFNQGDWQFESSE